MRISVQELLIVLAIVLLIFGPTQISKLIKAIKKGSKEVQKGLEGKDEEDEDPKKDGEEDKNQK